MVIGSISWGCSNVKKCCRSSVASASLSQTGISSYLQRGFSVIIDWRGFTKRFSHGCPPFQQAQLTSPKFVEGLLCLHFLAESLCQAPAIVFVRSYEAMYQQQRSLLLLAQCKVSLPPFLNSNSKISSLEHTEKCSKKFISYSFV